MAGGIPTTTLNPDAAAGAMLVKQLLSASGMGRALAGSSAVHEGLFLDTLADAVARTLPPMTHVEPTATAARLVDGGHVSSGYGDRADPFTGERAHHDGVDVAAPQGSNVHAAADGIVSRVEDASDYGHLVVVRHASGTETRYAHLEASSVEVGQQIRAGEILGQVGSTGRSTGPHLHFEVRQQGVVVEPTRALSGYRAVTNSQVQDKGQAARRAP